MIKYTGGWDMLHLPLSLSLKEMNLSCIIPLVHLNGNQMLVWGVVFKNLFVNMTSINQLEHEEDIETFNVEP